MKALKRISADRCCGALIDVQGFFLAQLPRARRTTIKRNTAYLVRLLNYFRIPIVVTLERPLDYKGALPKDIGKYLGQNARIFEKDFFDLCKDREIKRYLAGLKKRQVIVAGCETDVCVLQSCLGLIELGFEVYIVEELVFSSSPDVSAAVACMKGAGAIFTTYKMLYYELIQTVEAGPYAERTFRKFGAFPDDLPDRAR